MVFFLTREHRVVETKHERSCGTLYVHFFFANTWKCAKPFTDCSDGGFQNLLITDISFNAREQGCGDLPDCRPQLLLPITQYKPLCFLSWTHGPCTIPQVP
jgi:hypothetical protein